MRNIKVASPFRMILGPGQPLTDAGGVRRLPLRVNFIWTLIGNGVYAACQWGILTVLAKLGTPAMVGQFALGMAVTAPIMLFANLGLRPVQATDTGSRYTFGDYFGLRLITTTLALAVTAIVVVVGGYSGSTAGVIMLVGVAKGFESFSDVFYGHLQQEERMSRIAKSLMIKGPLSLVAMTAVIYATRSVLWGTAALAVAWALVFISYDRRLPPAVAEEAGQLPPPNADNAVSFVPADVRPRFEVSRLLPLVRLALPLGITTLLVSLIANIPRYVVERTVGQADLGIFAAMAYVTFVGTTIVTALGQSASPRLAKHYAAREAPAYHKTLYGALAVGAVLGVGGIVIAATAGKQLLTLLYQAQFAVYPDAFVWLMVAAALSYLSSFLGYSLTATRHFGIQPVIYTVTAILCTIACLLLIPRYGVAGAAWATVVTSLVQLGGLAGSNIYAIRKIRGDNRFVSAA